MKHLNTEAETEVKRLEDHPQKALIVTFASAYHAGFNEGTIVAEDGYAAVTHPALAAPPAAAPTPAIGAGAGAPAQPLPSQLLFSSSANQLSITFGDQSNPAQVEFTLEEAEAAVNEYEENEGDDAEPEGNDGDNDSDPGEGDEGEEENEENSAAAPQPPQSNGNSGPLQP